MSEVSSPWWRRPALRWALLAVILVLVGVLALWPRSSTEVANAPYTAPTVADSARAEAHLVPCPPASPGATGPLANLTVGCLADGKPGALGAMIAGRPALLNLWAYWCGPCAVELPMLQEYAAQVGPQLTVLTVHSDPDEAKALARLAGLGITLPGVEDPNASVRTAVGAPAVLPVSVLVRADGTIASVEVRAFRDVADIADTVANKLGVRA
ncbi:TlpA family protein disulfide reductase [Nocardia camponoti]|uniref:Thioredoxin domain-containing protein n=1 Tax=Nocardia camponoti TaxID=1616106 RepID=A0A917QNJ8_9NOCA|nr:TlpA disulfide reductase family protein [Nocardia camponoti]GGK60737.1 hypothetical protein GCM10011591_36290 [Nocardia camponoti]